MKNHSNDFYQFENELKKGSLVGDHPVFDRFDFPWVKQLEDNYAEIFNEYKYFIEKVSEHRLMNFQDISEEQKAITNDDKWKVIPLVVCNMVNKKTTAFMPKTFSVIDNIPEITTCFFSILYPGKYIPPHRGPYAGVLRCHLPLKVPKDATNCWIMIDKVKYSWNLGEVLIFDDTYDHEVFNNTTETRIVLFIDFLRPLPAELSELNKGMIEVIKHSDFVQNPKSIYEDWENRNLLRI